MKLGDYLLEKGKLSFQRRLTDLEGVVASALSLAEAAPQLLRRWYGEVQTAEALRLEEALRALREKMTLAAPQLSSSLLSLPPLAPQLGNTRWYRAGLALALDRLAQLRLELEPGSPLEGSLRELSRLLADLHRRLALLPTREAEVPPPRVETPRPEPPVPVPQPEPLPEPTPEPKPEEKREPVLPGAIELPPMPILKPEFIEKVGPAEPPAPVPQPTTLPSTDRLQLVKESLFRVLSDYGFSPEQISRILAEVQPEITELEEGYWEASIHGTFAGFKLGFTARFKDDQEKSAFLWKIGR